MESARYDRQLSLSEVGVEGQRRIQSSRLSVGVSPSSRIEAVYLERAGVGELEHSEQREVTFEHGRVFRHEAARSFGAGAWRALQQLAGVLRGRG